MTISDRTAQFRTEYIVGQIAGTGKPLSQLKFLEMGEMLSIKEQNVIEAGGPSRCIG